MGGLTLTFSLPALLSLGLLEQILFYSFSLLGGQMKEKIGTQKKKRENSTTSKIINILNMEVISV